MRWYYVLDMLANGDITKHEQILEMPTIHILNHLDFIKYKNRIKDDKK